MATTAGAPSDSLTTAPIRDLIAELARTEDVLRGCRTAGASPGQRAARRRQRELLDALHRHSGGLPPQRLAR